MEILNLGVDFIEEGDKPQQESTTSPKVQEAIHQKTPSKMSPNPKEGPSSTSTGLQQKESSPFLPFQSLIKVNSEGITNKVRSPPLDFSHSSLVPFEREGLVCPGVDPYSINFAN